MDKVDFLEECKATKHLEKEDVAQSFSTDVLDEVQISMRKGVGIKLEEPNKYFQSPEIKLISHEQKPFVDCPSEDITGQSNIQENVIDEQELIGGILIEQGMVAKQGNVEVTCPKGSDYPVVLDQTVTLIDHINVECSENNVDGQMDSRQNPVQKGKQQQQSALCYGPGDHSSSM